jgi:rod shape-determining protein MreB
MARDLCIDLGTATTRAFAPGRGLVADEPTLVAVDSRTDKVVAIGVDAVPMVARPNRFVTATRPMKRAAVSDFEATRQLLHALLERAGSGRFTKQRLVICVRAGSGPVEHRALRDAGKQAGAASVHLLSAPIAAALGAGLPLQEPMATRVVDVGAGLTEATVMSLASIVEHGPVRVAGADVDAAIVGYVRREYGLAISATTAEDVKISLADSNGTKAEVRGTEALTGLPKVIIVAADELEAAIAEPIAVLVDGVVRALAGLPAELANDLVDTGIHLVGGGALLRGLDRRLADAAGVPVQIVPNPRHAVVVGGARCLEQFDSLQSLFVPPPT